MTKSDERFKLKPSFGGRELPKAAGMVPAKLMVSPEKGKAKEEEKMDSTEVMGIKQFRELGAQVQRALPADISPTQAQRWIDRPHELGVALHAIFAGEMAEPGILPWQTLFSISRLRQRNIDFNEGNFSLEVVADDEQEWEVHEHHFAESVIIEEAFPELEKLGFRLLGGVRRVMEFTASHPDFHWRGHGVIATVRWQKFVPVFDPGCGLCLVHLRGWRERATPDEGFFVLRRKQG